MIKKKDSEIEASKHKIPVAGDINFCKKHHMIRKKTQSFPNFTYQNCDDCEINWQYVAECEGCINLVKDGKSDCNNVKGIIRVIEKEMEEMKRRLDQNNQR